MNTSTNLPNLLATPVCIAINEGYCESNGAFTTFYFWDGQEVTTKGGMYSDLAYNAYQVNATLQQRLECSKQCEDNNMYYSWMINEKEYKEIKKRIAEEDKQHTIKQLEQEIKELKKHILNVCLTQKEHFFNVLAPKLKQLESDLEQLKTTTY